MTITVCLVVCYQLGFHCKQKSRHGGLQRAEPTNNITLHPHHTNERKEEAGCNEIGVVRLSRYFYMRDLNRVTAGSKS